MQSNEAAAVKDGMTLFEHPFRILLNEDFGLSIGQSLSPEAGLCLVQVIRVPDPPHARACRAIRGLQVTRERDRGHPSLNL